MSLRAAARTSGGAGGSRRLTSSVIGMLEITSVAGIVSGCRPLRRRPRRCDSIVAAHAIRRRRCRSARCHRPPRPRRAPPPTSCRGRGAGSRTPRSASSRSSREGGRNTLEDRLRSERSLIRCAAHSAFSSEQEIPHTFSVYVLKNVAEEAAAEAVGHPLLEGLLGPVREELPAQVARDHAGRLDQRRGRPAFRAAAAGSGRSARGSRCARGAGGGGSRSRGVLARSPGPRAAS